MAKIEREKTGNEPFDKRKLALGIVSILFIIGLLWYGTKTAVLGDHIVNKDVAVGNTGSLRKTSAQNSSTFSLPSPLEQKVKFLKEEASKLSVQDVATSAPQIQKILKDINSLQSYPRDQAKQACMQVCDKF